jgi:uncharacterized protein YbjT (DUF2867 family)
MGTVQMTPTVKRKILLAGASGLVGRECLSTLLSDPDVESLTVVVRRQLTPAPVSERLHEYVVDFAVLEAHALLFRVDQVFCALGTTIRQAGSQEAFRRVDFDFPLTIARLALSQGARHFLLVSALGANSGSRVFYNRVKGELEDAIAGLGFPSVTVVQPSLLLGERSERRLGEGIAKFFMSFAPIGVRAVHARKVAAALVGASREDRMGYRVITNKDLHRQSA